MDKGADVSASAGVGAGTALQTLAIEMAGDATLVRDLQYRFHRYPSCFRGSEAVGWLVQHHRAINRVEAEGVASRMFARGLIRHVTDEHLFSDSFLFYRFSPTVGVAASADALTGDTECLTNPTHETNTETLRTSVNEI
jgi:hypothetical protein